MGKQQYTAQGLRILRMTRYWILKQQSDGWLVNDNSVQITEPNIFYPYATNEFRSAWEISSDTHTDVCTKGDSLYNIVMNLHQFRGNH